MCSVRYPRINSSFMNTSKQFISYIIDYYLMHMLKSGIYCHIILQKEMLLHAVVAINCERRVNRDNVQLKLDVVWVMAGS
jgi:hypothetical protein